MISRWSEAKISFDRLNKFLRRKELDKIATHQAIELAASTRDNDDDEGEDENNDSEVVAKKKDEDEARVMIKIVDGGFEWEKTQDDADEEEEERKKKEEKEKEKNEGDALATAKKAKRTPTSDDDDDDDVADGDEEDATLLTNMERGGLDCDEGDEGEGGDHGGFRLHVINVEVKRGELVAVIGRVGSGKTSLLNSMLGEMKRAAGQLHLNASAVSYVSQRYIPDHHQHSTFLEWPERLTFFVGAYVWNATHRAWIRNATVKENIVFGQPLDAALYRDVIRVCALTEDLRILPGALRVCCVSCRVVGRVVSCVVVLTLFFSPLGVGNSGRYDGDRREGSQLERRPKAAHLAGARRLLLLPHGREQRHPPRRRPLRRRRPRRPAHVRTTAHETHHTAPHTTHTHTHTHTI
jgi:energy-coupling factor transporter ATP-binding protein EcfA2